MIRNCFGFLLWFCSIKSNTCSPTKYPIVSAQLAVKYFSQLGNSSANLETTTDIIFFELSCTNRELCGWDFMGSYKGTPGLYHLPHAVWCCVEMPNWALKRWAPELGWCIHVSIAVQYRFLALQRSRADQSNKYSAAAILLSGYGLVSLWNMGLCDIYFVWTSWRNSMWHPALSSMNWLFHKLWRWTGKSGSISSSPEKSQN